jgi:hypothetical protein
MKFTKIFDVTDSDSPMVQSQTEYEANKNANSENVMNEDDQQDLIQHDLEVLLPESKEMMADWTCAEIKVDEINSDDRERDEQRQDLSPTGSSSSIESMDSFYKPEADQKDHELAPDNAQSVHRRDAREYTNNEVHGESF